MRTQSLEDVARKIFGTEDMESIERWTEYWSASRERNRRLLEAFERLVLIDFRDKQVLDIGCGTGGLGELVGEKCRLYVGGDYHFHVLQFAQAAGNRTFLQCSGMSLPFPDRTFDYIIAFDVIEHLTGGKPWQLEFLREMRRVLRPLGMIFLTTPNFWYPYDGHTSLYFPHYLPAAWADRYIARLNPGFLREHRTFSEIQLLTPQAFRTLLEESELAFLHDLPCGLDRSEFWRQFPLSGWLAYLGLGWYRHAEFWGILVRREARADLRLKLRKTWHYEKNQPSGGPVPDFQSRIDFDADLFNQQLGPGWYWHERDKRGFRWIRREAVCYLQAGAGTRYLRIHGYNPRANYFDVFVEGVRIGEHAPQANSAFEVEYLIPFPAVEERIWKIRIGCSRLFCPEDVRDQRELGLMIFSIGLA